MSDPEIAILRQKIHGLSADDYATALRSRLPETEIAVAQTPSEERELLEQVPIATGFELSPDEVEAAPNLDLFACVYAGVGHLDLDAFEANGTAVTNASGVHGPNIAEYVIGSILSHVRGFRQAWRQQDRNEWRSYPAREFQGSTVTVVGLGSIGQAIVDRLDPFGVDTIGVRYTPEKGGPTDEVLGFDEIQDALARTDYLVLACPLTDETRGLIDSEAFLTLPSDAFMVNIARGGVVDTDALVAAMQANRISGAALDVTDPEPLPNDHPLWDIDTVSITPHNAGHTPNYYERTAEILATNVERYRQGETEYENQVV
ncbi:phosphoglycerate dehydrogenase-like enzyme [Halohasta litchfieldiae]|jgi:phosphoglycerate dehydrogenase-like enzyme|uniref:Phosphoglycerate dehydrogenase n=1 Tax=Halohasta litchfieldiae TaxID=1073996 RepID=A0A1H6V4D0_9EURY|nr:D-2-hydroxyacid dehydrogenase [Halohasta litchfieldiae]ATW87511.1 phosphoglycerate dehydrogenase-like enzyme [Halohasta litchfieldiae]SEI99433.1 Phosphoglycerate dehydrogenase [Halohasta litchfieldiae]